MKLIIDIDEMEYSLLKECAKSENYSTITRIIANGIPYEEGPQGEWIRKGNETNFWYECDKCGCGPYYSHSIRTIRFCPNCGADMRGDKE